MDAAARLLALVAMFRRHGARPLSLEEVRAGLGPEAAWPGDTAAVRRAWQRDKRALKELGFEVTWDRAREGYRLADASRRPPLAAITHDDLALVREAARVAAGDPKAPLAPDALGAIERLAAHLDPETEDTQAPFVVHHPMRDPDAAAREVARLVTACWRRLPVTFRYTPESGGEGAPRRVDPWGVYARRGYWYLVGRCHARDAQRTFRVSRMAALQVEGLPDGKPTFAPPDGFDLRAQIGAPPWDWPLHAPVRAVFAIDAELAPLLARQLGGDALAEESRVTRTMTNTQAIEALLLEWLPRLRVVAPAEVAAAWRERLAGVAARHGSAS